MKMKFTSNIKCNGCIATITPFMTKENGIEEWAVDITVPEKTLEVNSAQLSEEEVIALGLKAGFKLVASH